MANAERNGVLNVDKQRIGAIYAKALLDAHEKTCKSEMLTGELEALVRDVLDPHPAFEQALGSALISHEDKVALLDRVLGGRVSPELLVFLKVLSAHERLDCLRAVQQQVRDQFNQRRGRVEVEVRVVRAIDSVLREEITQKLRSRLNAEPVVRVVEDPELIGGFVIRVGDTVFDGSVRTQLKRARLEMIDRSVELIETRRHELVTS